MTRKKKRNAEGEDIDKEIYNLKIYRFTKLCSEGRKPTPRSGHRIECTDTCLYSIGGYFPEDQLFREVWRFDFVSKVWTKLKPRNLPEELASSYTVLSGNVLFLHGGTGYPFGINLNESLYFSRLPKSDLNITFEKIKPSTYLCPPSRYGHSMALNGNYLYTVGGTTGHQYSMDVYEFNLETREWKKLYDCHDGGGPPARYRHEMIYYNDRLYIFGGGTSQISHSLEELPTFNLKTYQWEILKTTGDTVDVHEAFPVSRKCHGCIQDPHLLSVVYVNGGSLANPPGGEVALKDTWRIDLHTLKWKRISSLDLPYGVHFHSVAATPDGRMFVFGGITDQYATPERTADLHSAWITVPKLADACWEATQHYIRNGTYTLPDDIKSFGLPKKYEDRLISSGLLSVYSPSWDSPSELTPFDSSNEVTDEDDTLLY